MKVKLKNVRAAFCNVHEPVAFEVGGKLKYGCTFIIDPANKANVIALREALITAANEKWGAKAAGTLAELKKKDRVCFQEHEKHTADGEVYNGFEGMYSCTSSADVKPKILDFDKSPLGVASGKPYSGCYVDAVIEVWAQDNQYGKRINAQLTGIQFFKDGDAFSAARPASDDDFDDLSSEDGADDLM